MISDQIRRVSVGRIKKLKAPANIIQIIMYQKPLFKLIFNSEEGRSEARVRNSFRLLSQLDGFGVLEGDAGQSQSESCSRAVFLFSILLHHCHLVILVYFLWCWVVTLVLVVTTASWLHLHNVLLHLPIPEDL